MRRSKPNKRRSVRKARKQMGKTHKANKAFTMRGGIRL